MWFPGCPWYPKIGKRFKESFMGSSEVSKDKRVGNQEVVQVGGDASIQAEQECGALSQGLW